MSMSKKDFTAIADGIKEHNRINGRYSDFEEDQLEALMDVFKKIDPASDRERWLNYIAGTHGPNGGAVKKAVKK